MFRRESEKILCQGLTAMGISLTPEARKRLVAYCAELVRWNVKINLVARAELPEIWESHFLDSLSVLPLLAPSLDSGAMNRFDPGDTFPSFSADILSASRLPETRRLLLDIGTGAGFPGLVLKAASPELPVILVEPRQKRVLFLRQVIRTLGLKEVEVIRGRLGKGSAEVAGRRLTAPVVTSRAFANIADFLLHAAAVNPPGGRVICMKGPKAEEEIAAWRLARPESPYRLETINEYRLPFSGKTRKLLVFRKKKS